ncbi:glutathione peroxidase [Candidatus Contendibacter odensensis]|uniref:Hybrid peroxiredoxin hyPrx5 n=1 Tax=Candidatus Contendobacter odensis Run_B_J11 TaxID=1400861 RepID=A0A7U7J2T4_9GAMM|nr:glutathione peroxidase [Candidatus Contendobacter odensis]CDH45394.1 Hybrid peroxiredoxin hyPrx5 [Candidatus Contendobacter odensis Run_B_J11]
MLKSREGQKVPNVTFPIRVNGEWQKVSSDALFKDKTVVLFALPGAFTPTCSSAHLPRYNELVGVFKANGIDSVICLAVNDPFVMETWKEEQNAKDIYFLPDGNGEFSEGMGLLVDKTAIGLGKRSWRYSMLVKDGLIQKMFIEPEEPGDPFQVSDADTLLKHINPNASIPPRISLFSKPGCPHCARARKMLREKGYRFEEMVLGSHGVSYRSLQAVTGRGTTPQVYVDGQHIGGADELTTWLAK